MRRYRSARWLPPYPIRHRPPPVRTVVKRGCKATFRVTILWELFRKLRLDVSYLRHPAKLTEGTPPRFLSPSPRVSPPPQPRRRIEAKLLLLLHVVEKGTSPWRRWEERGWVRFRVRDGGGDKGARTSLVSGRRKNCSGVQIIGRCFVYKFSSTLEARKGDTILFTSYPFPRSIVSHSQSPSNDPLQRSLPTFSSPLPFRRLITIDRLLQKEISQATVSQKLVEQTNNDRWGERRWSGRISVERLPLPPFPLI